MTIFRLDAPSDTTSVIGTARTDGSHVRIILGVGYSDRAEVADYAARAGYTVTEVDEIPQSYREQSRRLDAWPVEYKNTLTDGADPKSAYTVTGPDGHTPIDIRHIIDGTITP